MFFTPYNTTTSFGDAVTRLRPPIRLRFSLNVRKSPLSTMLAILLFCIPLSARADDRGWDYEPYRIRALVALDLPGGMAQQMDTDLPSYLQRRVHAAIGPVWAFDVELATGSARQRILSDIATLPDTPPTDFLLEGADKLVLIGVRWQPQGYELTAREFDNLVQRWGMPIRRQSRQEEALPEQVFALLWQAVAPLAQLELDPDDENRVVLKPRGAALSRHATGERWARPGEVFLPVLRRTTRTRQLVEGGIQVVPWTYVELIESSDGKSVAQIHSGTRRPFGVRRQGRVEQIAIALRSDPAGTVVRFHSRSAPDKPLVGYEVFSQTKAGAPEGDKDPVSRVGSTDRDGKLVVPPGHGRVRLLYVKNGGNLLARLPIVPGAQRQLDVPLPDDDARLSAEAHLAALREDLIDTVARRNILIARARQKMKQKDFAGAQKLLSAIDKLPGRSQFHLELTTAARRMRSDDPQIQRRIDQLFEGTQTVLSQYLDVRPISELHDELRAARPKGT